MREWDENGPATEQALLAWALLFVPPAVPSCCDVKAAIQSREKGNHGLSPHQ